jgi:hypothetical protein
MNSQRKVAVITGASRGIGEALVAAYRERDYCWSRWPVPPRPSSDPDIL